MAKVCTLRILKIISVECDGGGLTAILIATISVVNGSVLLPLPL